MTYFATSLAVVAGVCFGIGSLFLLAGARWSADRRRNLLFALFALAYGAAVITARSAYVADSPDGYFSAIRISLVFGVLGYVLLIWFVAAYSGASQRFLLWVLTAALGVVGTAAAFFPSLILDTAGGVSAVELPWGETLLMVRQGSPALNEFFGLVVLASVAYIVAADVSLYRKGRKRDATTLAVGLAWFAFMAVEEVLVVLGVFDGVVLADFGFLGFVVAMGLSESYRVIETETELRELRDNLEATVAERTAELEEAQALLVVQAEEQASEAERSRLARELHDAVSQTLFSINLVAGSLPRLWRSDPATAARTTEELQRLTRGALAEMRGLLRELRPQAIVETDLETLVTQLSDGLSARHDIPIRVNSSTNGDLPEPVHLAFYRIAQEAMNNVAKHADASSLVVELDGGKEHAHLSVADDGAGFDVAAAPTGSMGLEIMRERAAGVGARITITSKPGCGTTIEADWDQPTNGGAA